MGRKVCLGGTFNRIHAGHRALLAKAFEFGDEVLIGLTTDRFAALSRGPGLLDYDARLQNLESAAEELCGGTRFVIFPLDDPMGRAASEDYDAIVVSRETVQGAELINRARAERGLPPLEVIVVDMVLASDGKPISSSRVVRGEIYSDGEVKTT